MGQSPICLNCYNDISGKFCSNCGQKTDTHRITFKHFITHDILHGVWHFEKGIFYTLRETLLNPGKAALHYISGRRIKYYNVFYLTLLIIGVQIFINHIQNDLSHQYFGTELAQTHGKNVQLSAFLENYSKIIIFAFVPLLAINSFLLFRKSKLNFSEHFIIAGMIFLGVMIINLISMIFSFVEFLDSNFTETLELLINVLTPASILLFLVINYYKVFYKNYSTTSTIIRILIFVLLLLVEISLLAMILFFSLK